MRPRKKRSAAGSPAERSARSVTRRIELTGDLGRREAEALRLEIWGLARRHGVRLKTLRVESVDEP